MFPLNFLLTREYGIVGPAVANMISFIVYNSIRYIFLLRRFQMQPFDLKTLYTVLLTGACFAASYFLFRNQSGLLWIILRSLTFILPFILLTLWLKLSPDVVPVWQTVKKRMGWKD
jgi:O-antigen/teichoic acid export membrane protein